MCAQPTQVCTEHKYISDSISRVSNFLIKSVSATLINKVFHLRSLRTRRNEKRMIATNARRLTTWSLSRGTRSRFKTWALAVWWQPVRFLVLWWIRSTSLLGDTDTIRALFCYPEVPRPVTISDTRQVPNAGITKSILKLARKLGRGGESFVLQELQVGRRLEVYRHDYESVMGKDGVRHRTFTTSVPCRACVFFIGKVVWSTWRNPSVCTTKEDKLQREEVGGNPLWGTKDCYFTCIGHLRTCLTFIPHKLIDRFFFVLLPSILSFFCVIFCMHDGK